MNVEAQRKEAEALVAQGRVSAAIELLTLTFRHGDELQKLHIYNSLWRHYQRVVPKEAAGATDYVRLIAEGNAARLANDQKAAERSYREAIALLPQMSFAHSRLANTFAYTGRHEDARKSFEECCARVSGWHEDKIKFNPEFVRSLASTEIISGKMDWAITCVPEPGDVIVFAACDTVYWRKYGEGFLASILRHGGDGVIAHIHLVDPDDAAMADVVAMAERKRGIAVNFSFDRAEDRPYNLETYYACSRFLRLPGLLKRYGPKQRYIVMDIDVLVRKNLRESICDPAPGHAALIRDDSPGVCVWTRFLAGVVHIADADAAWPFFDAVARYASTFIPAPNNRFLDQIALYCVNLNKSVLPGPPDVRAFEHHIVSTAISKDPAVLYFYASSAGQDAYTKIAATYRLPEA